MNWTISRGTLVSGLALILLATPAPGAEQEQSPAAGSPGAGQAQPQPPAGSPATGAGWTTNVAPTEKQPLPDVQGQSVPLSDEQIELIQQISDYFNSIEHLEGRFAQVNPNGDLTRGKFYLQRPGRLRFDYAPPSRLRIVADGRYLSIEDHDLRTVDQYPLEATPFQLLLGDNVDLLRDAAIIDFSRSQDIASLTLEDKKDGSRGRLQLFFTLPDLEIKEWVITDPQGLDTRIQLSKLVLGKAIKKEFFKSSALDFQGASEQ
ncbi:MAG: outer membrane lipoprotein carrier protein LolA [Hyphomicrobiales bacterium]|nr:outer membrane lipoprotein carrier protein LolA [Hyphomicrobiales bacterium]